MLEKFYPGEYVDSTYEIDFDRLYEEGYRGVLFDIDNTLVRHGAPADERACALFAHLKELGFSCMLLSNNKEPRVKMFHDAVHVSYIYKAGKPKKDGYEKAMQQKVDAEKISIDDHSFAVPSSFGFLLPYGTGTVTSSIRGVRRLPMIIA